MLQIAQAAVDQLARGAGCRGGEIVFLAKIDRPAAPGGVSGNPAAVHAAADDGDVEGRQRRRRGLQSSSPSRKRKAKSELIAQGKRKNELSNEYIEAPASYLRRLIQQGRRPL